MKDNVEIRAMTAPWYGGIQLLVKTERAVGVNVVMRDVSEAERQRDFRPTLWIGMNEAQVLMDDLWNAGLRPTEGTGSAGSLRATERHLEDMRKIVFKKLGI